MHWAISGCERSQFSRGAGATPLAARGDQDLLLAARDGEVAPVVQFADVTGREPAVRRRVDDAARVRVPVAAEDLRHQQDLAIPGYPYPGARQRPAHRAQSGFERGA